MPTPATARRTVLLAVWALCLLMGAPAVLHAHPGALDQYGGHFHDETGLYHYHKPAKDIAVRKREWLAWERYPHTGRILQARVDIIDEPGAIWLYFEYRPAYQALVPHVAAAHRDDRRKLLRVYLKAVSPEETGAREQRFADWFRRKVVYELKQKLLGRQVRVSFEMLGAAGNRMRGHVFLGDEHINLWMVRNGWSYYVVGEGGEAHDKSFRAAEDTAKRDRKGIWEHTP